MIRVGDTEYEMITVKFAKVGEDTQGHLADPELVDPPVPASVQCDDQVPVLVGGSVRRLWMVVSTLPAPSSAAITADRSAARCR